jgi:hypothetical protein
MNRLEELSKTIERLNKELDNLLSLSNCMFTLSMNAIAKAGYSRNFTYGTCWQDHIYTTIIAVPGFELIHNIAMVNHIPVPAIRIFTDTDYEGKEEDIEQGCLTEHAMYILAKDVETRDAVYDAILSQLSRLDILYNGDPGTVFITKLDKMFCDNNNGQITLNCKEIETGDVKEGFLYLTKDFNRKHVVDDHTITFNIKCSNDVHDNIMNDHIKDAESHGQAMLTKERLLDWIEKIKEMRDNEGL